jgi:hypothetical protein
MEEIMISSRNLKGINKERNRGNYIAEDFVINIFILPSLV